MRDGFQASHKDPKPPKTLRTSDLYRIKITQATQIHKKSKIRDSRGDKRGEIHMNFLLIKQL
jgi:hypothetical protein